MAEDSTALTGKWAPTSDRQFALLELTGIVVIPFRILAVVTLLYS
jgi:hypothetical protein